MHMKDQRHVGRQWASYQTRLDATYRTPSKFLFHSSAHYRARAFACGRTSDRLSVGCSASTAAVDVVADVMDLLAVFVGHCVPVRRPRIRAENNPVLRSNTRTHTHRHTHARTHNDAGSIERDPLSVTLWKQRNTEKTKREDESAPSLLQLK